MSMTTKMNGDCRTMPTFGSFREPRPWETGGMRYGKVRTLSATYLTSYEAASQMLPEGFRPADTPHLTFNVQQCTDVEWLHGHGYELVGIDIGAVFEGHVDRNIEGTYCAVMWENMCEPIIGGREHSGVPKVFADIQIVFSDDTVACRVSRFGHTFLDIAAQSVEHLSSETCRSFEQLKRDHTWMNVKHIPNLENDGADVSYVTVYPSSGKCAVARSATAKASFFPVTPKQAPTQHDYINMLAQAPLLELQSAYINDWEDIRLLDRKPKRLR